MRKHPEDNDGVRLDCAGAEPLVEAYVDGDLEAAVATAFEVHVGRCAACAAELELARRIGGELRALPAQECPPTVVRNVLGHARRPTLGARLAAWLLPVPPRVWQGALAMLVVAALAVGYYSEFSSETRPTTPVADGYSAEDVARAEAELKLALAYLGRIGETASSAVSNDVLEQRVMAPISQSIAGALLPQPQPPAKPGDSGGSI